MYQFDTVVAQQCENMVGRHSKQTVNLAVDILSDRVATDAHIRNKHHSQLT